MNRIYTGASSGIKLCRPQPLTVATLRLDIT